MKHQRDHVRGAVEARCRPSSGNVGEVVAFDHKQGQGSFLRRVSVLGAAGAIVIALLGLVGYVPGLASLGSIREDYIPMAPSTAISFIVLGGILLAITLRSLSGVSLVLFGALAALVSLFGALEVAGHFTGTDLNFEDALVPSAGYLGEIPIGRMSPSTGAAFLFAGLSTLALVLRSTARSRRTSLEHWAGSLGSLVLAVSIVFSLAYLYGSPLLYGQSATVPMALTTALAFLMLGTAALGAAGEDAIPLKLLFGAKRADKPMSVRRRFLALALIMVGNCAMVMVVMMVVLYRHEVKQHRRMLQVTAQSQARLIEAIAHFDAKIAGIMRHADPDHDAVTAALSQITDAHDRYEGFGRTGEFALARRDGDSIVFVLRHRHQTAERPAPVAFDSDLAEPMRRALAGLSGTVIGLDYRGETVLAAHEPVPVLNLGIVAKIDLAEIREPFIRSGLAAGTVALFVVLAGTALFLRIANPIIARLEAHSRNLEKEIEERKRAEEAMRESEEKHRELTENLPQRIFHKDTNLVYVSCNKHYARDLGIAPDEIEGKTDFDFYPKELAEKYRADDLRVMKSGQTEEIEESYLKDGRKLIVQIVKTPLTDDANNVTGILGIFWDITERKRAEEALRSEKLLSEDYINSLPGLFYVFDEERFVRWNSEWERTTGYSSEELSTKYGTDFFEGEDRVLIEERMRKVFRDGFADAEAELVTKDGRRIPYYFTGLRKEFNGRPHLVGLGIDITDRKKVEAERRALEAQLRQSQKMEAIGQLAGGVAHDFNNILTAILGNVEFSIDSVRRELGADHEAVRSIEQIEKAAQRASALTRQLLTFSRRGVIQPEVLNLNHILTDLDKMLRRLITKDIALETVTDPELQSVRADAGQLEQVIVNLVVNAAHAMPDGGRLTLETQNVTLDEDYTNDHPEAQPGPYVLLAVSDSGHGMDAATRERIFEPFFTTKSVDKGTGLGLATVHGIVKQSAGHIMVYSEPGRGTTFKIYLPAIEATPADRTPISQPGAPPRGHETVLLCEDDRPVCKLIALSLQTAGYTVITANSGQEGIEAAQAHAGSIDLLITDVMMPDMNGRALSQRLCATFPGLPTLFISGYTADVIAHRGVLHEGVEFLEKPFTRQSLLTKVRAVLDKTRSNG